jgi:hypothetical protein
VRQLLARAALLLAALIFTTAAGHAAGWHYYDPDCPVAVGEKSMKFVAMQPKKNIDRVCDALSETGPSVIVLDAGDNELRDMTWDIRILRADAADATPDPETSAVGRLPPQKFRNGMVNFDHNFAEPGNYVLYVKFSGDDGAKSYIGRHPFSVGLVTDDEMYLYAGFAVFLALLAGVTYTLWRQGKLGFKVPDVLSKK